VDLEGITGTVADIEGDMVKQSSLEITPDYAQIGSMRIDGDTVGSLLRVSPSGIDAVAEAMRLSGELFVKGDIQAYAVEAIEGDFARLWADEFSAITIDVDDIQGFTARFEYLYTLNANIEKLVSQTAFINKINTLSLNAVYGNISDLRTELLTANVVTSNHIKVENALIDKMFASTALIERLTSKSAFIRDIQAIEITANQLNLNVLQNKLGQAEGGLYIYGPDGRVLINNSLLRASFDVQIRPNHSSSSVSFSGLNYMTGSSSWQTFEHFYTDHKGSQLLVSWAYSMTPGSPSNSETIQLRTRGFGGYNPIGTQSISRTVSSGTTGYFNQIIDLGVPNYSGIQAYLEMRRDPNG